MKKLTSPQQKPLFDLIEYQRDPDRPKEFELAGSFVVEPPAHHGASPITKVKRSTVYLWHQLGLIQIAEYKGIRFELRVEAFEHYRRVKTWWLLRGALNVFDTWKGDIRTAVIAMVFGVIGAILLNLLGY